MIGKQKFVCMSEFKLRYLKLLYQYLFSEKSKIPVIKMFRALRPMLKN